MIDSFCLFLRLFASNHPFVTIGIQILSVIIFFFLSIYCSVTLSEAIKSKNSEHLYREGTLKDLIRSTTTHLIIIFIGIFFGITIFAISESSAWRVAQLRVDEIDKERVRQEEERKKLPLCTVDQAIKREVQNCREK